MEQQNQGGEIEQLKGRDNTQYQYEREQETEQEDRSPEIKKGMGGGCLNTLQ